MRLHTTFKTECYFSLPFSGKYRSTPALIWHAQVPILAKMRDLFLRAIRFAKFRTTAEAKEWVIKECKKGRIQSEPAVDMANSAGIRWPANRRNAAEPDWPVILTTSSELSDFTPHSAGAPITCGIIVFQSLDLNTTCTESPNA